MYVCWQEPKYFSKVETGIQVLRFTTDTAYVAYIWASIWNLLDFLIHRNRVSNSIDSLQHLCRVACVFTGLKRLIHGNLLSYIVGHYNPSVRILDLVSYESGILKYSSFIESTCYTLRASCA